MANIQCKMCGGTIDVPIEEVEEGSSGECPYCGTLMVFSQKRGTLSVDYPALEGQSENTDTEESELSCDLSEVHVLGQFSKRLLATKQYAELEKQIDAILEKQPENPPLLAQKALAICMLVMNNGTDAIRISEVASLFTHCMDFLTAAEKAGLKMSWLEGTRAILAKQVPVAFPKMAEATLLRRLYTIAKHPNLLEDDVEDIGIIIEQIDAAVEAFSNYPEFDGIEKAVVESVKPIIVDIGNGIVDSLLVTFLKNPDRDACDGFFLQTSRLYPAQLWAFTHAETEKEAESIRSSILKALKALIEHNGYDYVQDEWGAYHKESWLPQDHLDSQRQFIEDFPYISSVNTEVSP